MASEFLQPATYHDKNQTSTVLAKLNEQRKLSRFCDVVLKVCGEQIFAHSNVLAAASNYFGSFLGHGQDWPRAFSQKTPQIIEIYIDSNDGDNGGYGEAVRKVVDFMYTSEIYLTTEITNQVSEIAKIMQMDKILEYCSRFARADFSHNEIESDVPKVSTGTMTDYERTAVEGENDEDILNLGTVDETEIDDVTKDPDYEGDLLLQQNQQKRKRGRGRPKKSQELNSKPSTNEPYSKNCNNEEEDEDLCVFFVDNSSELNANQNENLTKNDIQSHITDGAENCGAGESLDIINKEEANISHELSKDSENGKYKDKNTDDDGKGKENESSTKIVIKSEPTSPKPRRYSRRVRKAKERPDFILPDLAKVKKPDEERDKEIYQNKDAQESTPSTDIANIRYMCKKCGFMTAKFNDYTQHKTIEHPVPSQVPTQIIRKEFKCDKCDFITKKQPEYREHVKNHLHTELICSFCEYQGETKEEFDAHVERHSGTLPFFCLNCDLKFKNKAQLNAHLPKHSEVKPFICNLCNAGFKWKHALKSHMIVHSTTKDHLCDICGFATAHKSMLKAHKLIHSGNTYKCQFHNCNFQATKKQNLKYHMLTHSGEKPHQCEICGQSFSLVKNMKRHKLMHSNYKPLKCDIGECQFGTTRYDKLKEHKLKQHGSGEPPAKKLRISDYQTLSDNSQIIHITEGQLNEALAATQNIPEGQIIATVDQSGLIGVQYAELENAADFIHYVTSIEST